MAPQRLCSCVLAGNTAEGNLKRAHQWRRGKYVRQRSSKIERENEGTLSSGRLNNSQKAGAIKGSTEIPALSMKSLGEQSQGRLPTVPSRTLPVFLTCCGKS